MRLLIDAQLPPALCDWFNERGHPAEHVFGTLGGQTPDQAIALHVEQYELVLVTKDDDFPASSSANPVPPRLASLWQHHQSRAAPLARRAVARRRGPAGEG